MHSYSKSLPKPWLTGGLILSEDAKFIPKKDTLPKITNNETEIESPELLSIPSKAENETHELDPEIQKLKDFILAKLTNPLSEMPPLQQTSEPEEKVSTTQIIERLKQISKIR